MNKANADLRKLHDLIDGRATMYCDPGIRGTGLAYWGHPSRVQPDWTESLVPKISKGAEWTKRAEDILRRFKQALIKTMPTVLVLEDQAVFEASAEGYAASKDGSLIRLAQITGAFAGVALLRFMDVYFLPVVTWKGQLPKHVTEQRIIKFTGMRYDSNHVYDAVGMGIAVNRGTQI